MPSKEKVNILADAVMAWVDATSKAHTLATDDAATATVRVFLRSRPMPCGWLCIKFPAARFRYTNAKTRVRDWIDGHHEIYLDLLPFKLAPNGFSVTSIHPDRLEINIAFAKSHFQGISPDMWIRKAGEHVFVNPAQMALIRNHLVALSHAQNFKITLDTAAGRDLRTRVARYVEFFRDLRTATTPSNYAFVGGKRGAHELRRLKNDLDWDVYKLEGPPVQSLVGGTPRGSERAGKTEEGREHGPAVKTEED